MTVPAWQKRQSDQQQFVSALADQVRGKADDAESYDLYMLDFGISLMKLLRARRGGDGGVDTNQTGRLLTNFLPKINEFARVPEEIDALLVQLFEHLQAGITGQFHREYQRVCVHDPKAAYGTDSATDEVEL